MGKLILLILTLASVRSFAGPNLGCGPSAVLVNDDSVFGFTCATTTDYSSSAPTKVLAITSGSSQCKTSGLVNVDKEKIFFVERNYHSLSVELAKGEGEALNTLSQLYGCNSPAVFSQELRRSYDHLFHDDQSAFQLTVDLENEINKNPNLKQICAGA